MSKCSVCQAILKQESFLFENERACFFSLKKPTLDGSGVIVPKTHYQNFFDLPDDDLLSILSLTKEIRKAFDYKFHPQGYSLEWSYGKVAGQKLDHCTLQILPRYADEPYAGKNLSSWLINPENKRVSRREDDTFVRELDQFFST